MLDSAGKGVAEQDQFQFSVQCLDVLLVFCYRVQLFFYIVKYISLIFIVYCKMFGLPLELKFIRKSYASVDNFVSCKHCG